MRISIFASIWCQNLGDELILKNEIQLLEEKHSTTNKNGVLIKPKFLVYSYDVKHPFLTQDNVTYKTYFPFGVRKKRNIFINFFGFISFLHHSSRADRIIVGGGWLLYDSEVQENKKPLDLWLFRSKVFRFFRKKFEFFAVWIDVKEPNNLTVLKKILSKADAISVRDSQSQKTLDDLWYTAELVSDPVLSDAGEKEKGSYMLEQFHSQQFSYQDLSKFNLEGKRIGLSLRQWYLVGSESTHMQERMEEWKINELINYLLSLDVEIVLLPHSFHKTDLAANDYVFLKKFLRPWRNISIRNTMQDVYEQYTTGSIDLCIAMRLHSIILSQVYEIPFIALSYSTKTDEIIEQINV